MVDSHAIDWIMQLLAEFLFLIDLKGYVNSYQPSRQDTYLEHFDLYFLLPWM